MEHHPLFQNDECHSHLPQPDDAVSNGSDDQPVKNVSIRAFFICVCALVFGANLTAGLLELPMIRLVELMVCRRLVDAGFDDEDEEACKTPEVQNLVAHIIGYKTTLDALPCLLTILSYGFLSSFWGRKPVILLQISGRLLALIWIIVIGFTGGSRPPELIWMSSLFLFLGGGVRAEISVVYTSFCDVISTDNRTKLLSLAHAAEGVAGFMSYPIASMLMTYRLWAPFALAIIINIVEFIVLWQMAETAPNVSTTDLYQNQNEPLARNVVASISWRELISFRVNYSDLWHVFRHRSLDIIFGCFFIKRIAFAGEDFIPQYASEITHRRIRETFWLPAAGDFGMFIALSLLLPVFTQRLESPVKDMWVIRGSLVSIIGGFFAVWRGRTVTVLCAGYMACGLGEGLDVGLQSLGSFIVDQVHHGIFFSVSGLLGVAGEIIGGPLMAAIYAIRDKNGEPLGYCFLLAAISFAGILSGSYAINNTSRPLE